MSAQEADEEDNDNVKWINNLIAESDSNELEAPIDLNIATMTVKKLEPLIWCNYEVPPKKLKLTNTGKSVLLSVKWHRDSPFLTSGPFLARYTFSQIHFHWGQDYMDGSYHSVDGGSLPMELHIVHFKSDYLNQEVAMRKPDEEKPKTSIILCPKFQTLDNPKMNPIVKALPLIEQADFSTRLVPWPMTDLLRPFSNDYFLYRGSVSSGTRVHNVLWLLSRQPIGISIEQVTEFYALKTKNFEPLGRKARILHDTRDQSIYHVNPSGSLHASLLPTPRDVISPNPMGSIQCCESVPDGESSKPGEKSSAV